MPILMKKIKDDMKNLKKQVRTGPNKMVLEPDPRSTTEYNRGLKVSKLEISALIGIKSLTYKGIVNSENPKERDSKNKKLTVFIQFFNIEFKDKEDEEYNLSVMVKGKKWWYKLPKLSVNSVKLKCSCFDFRFKFEKELQDKKGLIGRFRKYKRKTPPPPVGRGFANPTHVLGFCKHMWTFTWFLKRTKKLDW